jgi:hypothetical protein
MVQVGLICRLLIPRNRLPSSTPSYTHILPGTHTSQPVRQPWACPVVELALPHVALAVSVGALTVHLALRPLALQRQGQKQCSRHSHAGRVCKGR